MGPWFRNKVQRTGPKGLCGVRRAPVPAEGWHLGCSIYVNIISCKLGSWQMLWVDVLRTLEEKLEYSEVFPSLAAIFKICIENGQINTAKIAKSLNCHKTSTK